nr:MAG TPA: hypothetical protein [Caudoviricetes sp.]
MSLIARICSLIFSVIEMTSFVFGMYIYHSKEDK